ncbi:MAG: C25 family cysteine peptidase [bacterium]
MKAEGFTFIGKPGVPELPLLYLHYIIPPFAKVESLIILQSNAHEIPGQFLIYPCQPPIVSGETVPWVPPDTLIYNSDDKYPANFIEVVNEGVMDGARIVTIAIHPIQYRPKSKQLLIISHINFEIAFGTNTLPEVRPSIRGKFEQSIYDAVLKNGIMNDYEIPAYYQKPVLVEENQLGQTAPFPTGPAMIITDPIFADAFQPYADWLTDQGIRAQIISPAQIYGYFRGRDNAERIRNYIKYCHKYAGGTYFILGGDGGNPPKLPFRKCYCMNSGHPPPSNDTIPCDYYFCALDGNWNADGDAVWGEMNDDVDQFPEVFVGRIPCSSVQEVNNWCYKALTYEKSPCNTNLFDSVIWIWQYGTWPNQWKMADTMRFPTHFTHIVAENYDAESAFNLFDDGYMFTNIQTHGRVLGFWPNGNAPCSIKSYIEPPPDWWGAGLNHLTNDNKYFINYCVGCKTGAFDWSDTCVADAFVDAYQDAETDKPVGACASIEHTRFSWESQPMSSPGAYSVKLQNEYYELLFSTEYTGVVPPEPAYERIGVALAQAKTKMTWGNSYHRWVCYATNLFGSPTTDAWTKNPGDFLVSHPISIFQGIQTNFTVTVKDAGTFPPAPLQYAKVCLNNSYDIYEVGWTNTNGQVTFTITPSTCDTITVTVTRLHNTHDYSQYLPSQTICEVVAGGGGGEQSAGSENIAPDCLCITQMPTLFRNHASIRFGIPEETRVDLTIYDIMGSKVKILKEGVFQAGYYTEKINTKALSSGVYFIILRQDKEKVSRKFVIMK